MIIILTFGKVCSTSLRVLLEEEFPCDVLFSHGRFDIFEQARAFAAAEPELARSTMHFGFGDNETIEARLRSCRATGESVAILTGVREPVARSLSAAMEMLDSSMADCVDPNPERVVERVIERVRGFWINEESPTDPVGVISRTGVRCPLSWLAQEIEQPFGFDLLGAPFDPALGYYLLEHQSVRLLLFRAESAPRAVEEGLSKLFGPRTFELPKQNVREHRNFSEVYRAVKDRFKLPPAILDQIYSHPYVRHFFTDEELGAAKSLWAET